MNGNKSYYLVCKSVCFYSAVDESLFFEWIKRIARIQKVDGAGDEFYLYFKNASISDNDLRDLLAMFYRYKIDMKQLGQFFNEDNKEWFYGKPKGYWHRRVFGV